MKITTRTTIAQIKEALEADGYGHLVNRAAEIKTAANTSCLMWNSRHIITTDSSRITSKPR